MRHLPPPGDEQFPVGNFQFNVRDKAPDVPRKPALGVARRKVHTATDFTCENGKRGA